MTPIQEEWFNTRAYRTLLNEGIETLEELAAYGIHPMLRIPNVGNHTVACMRGVLAQHGLQFVDEGKRKLDGYMKSVPAPNGYGGKWREPDVVEEPSELTPDLFSTRAYNAVLALGVSTFQELSDAGVVKLLMLPNVGRGTVTEIDHVLEHRGLELRGASRTRMRQAESLLDKERNALSMMKTEMNKMRWRMEALEHDRSISVGKAMRLRDALRAVKEANNTSVTFNAEIDKIVRVAL